MVSDAAHGLADATAVPPHLMPVQSDHGPTETVNGRDAVRRRLEQAERLARVHVRVIDRPAVVSPDPTAELGQEWSMLRRGGVRRRVVYDSAGLASLHQLTAAARGPFVADLEARAISGVPCGLALFDDRIAAIPHHATPEGIDSLIVVHPSPLLEALAWLFERQWDAALPLRLSTTKRDDCAVGLSARDRQLLVLLTSGLDDDTIAKHLRISDRVMQNRIRSMLDHLGVQTREQAARHAASLGWIPLRPDDERAQTLG